MKGIRKTLLCIEVVICFAPAILLLTTGVFILPFQLMLWAQEPVLWEGPAMLLAMVGAGLIGLTTLAFVLGQLLNSQGSIRRPLLVLTCVVIAAAPLVPYALSGSAGFVVMALLPLCCTLHILYLARRMLLPLWRPSSRPIQARLALPAIVLIIAGGLYAGVNSIYLSEDEVNDHRAVRTDHKPRSYSYVMQPGGYIEGRVRLPMRITVGSDGFLTAVNLSTPSPGSRFIPDVEDQLVWSMEDVFDSMAKAVREGAQVRAMFDQDLGYVRKVYVDMEDPDSGWTLELTQFKVLTP